MNNTQPHIQITRAQISPYVLLPGDPARVDMIGAYLNNFCILANTREFRVGIGTYKDKRITICSTGIGCPSTAIAVTELINAGAQYLIRVGTCGGAWRADIPLGSVVIPTACVRDEGTTDEYIPRGFPAVADISIVNALKDAADKNAIKNFAGVNRTHDAFYGSQKTILNWGEYLREEKWGQYDTPIFSSDMETSALYVLASLYGVQAGCILAVNADPEPLKDRLLGKKQAVITENSTETTKNIVEKSIQVALNALSSL